MTSLKGCAVATVLSALVFTAPAFGQQAATQQPRAAPPVISQTPSPPSGQPRPVSTAMPQGFSVVLVLGDLQGASMADDVPVAARKALADMRDFLPFKSYRLLDAAWLLCCAHDGRRNSLEERRVADLGSQFLRGPEGQEYELKLSTSRAENSRVFVRFILETGESDASTAIADVPSSSELGDLQDRRAYLETQVQETRKKVEVGVAPKADLAKIEMELRSVQRRIADLNARAGHTAGRARSRTGRASTSVRTPRATTSEHTRKILDASFTMDVGETVVVGTSRLKGGTKALIALLTAVPPRAARQE
jgi:hypothetical protein